MTRRPAPFVALVLVALAGCTADRPNRSVAAAAPSSCNWETAGNGLARLGASGCPETIDRSNVERLTEVWFGPTEGEVTAAPAVDDTAVFAGDWSGAVTSWNRDDGSVRWSVDLGRDPVLYSGQFTSTPSLAVVDGRPALVIGGGRRLVALDRTDGSVIWERRLGDAADPTDPTEIQGAPAVAGGAVVVGFDVHQDPTRRAGVMSVDLRTGEPQWRFDPEAGLPSGGCGGVWGAPAVDLAGGVVVVGTVNCSRDGSWGPYAEAVVSLDLATGRPRWSFQPHERGNDQDWDFAGAPNLFEIGGRAVVGLGNKDGWYYVVDRATGELVWKSEAQRQDADADGFAFGGFIGATAVTGGASDAVIVGATAIGDCPCVHGFDAGTGRVRWQNSEPSGSYATTAATRELAFVASVDQTLRAFDVDDGSVVWSAPTRAVSASGPAIAGRSLYLGVGFKEPGSTTASRASGVQAFRVLAPGESAPTTRPPTTVAESPPVVALTGGGGRCIDSPCQLATRLKEPPADTDPKLTLRITRSPLEVTLTATGLGEPAAWLREGSAAARAGATVFGLFASPRDDQPQLGTIVCTFRADEPGCSATSIGRADAYSRFTVVVLADATTAPTLQDGFDRLVTTQQFEPPLAPAEASGS